MKKLLGVLLLAVSGAQAKKVINGIEKTVVYVDMVADMFHEGHINMLKRAQAMGDYLVVGLMSDEDTASYKRAPICTLAERTAVIAACKYVDKVIPASPLRLTAEFIAQEGIDMVLHGDDMNEETLKLYYQVPMAMGILKTLPYTPGISTTDIINRILARSAEFTANNIRGALVNAHNQAFGKNNIFKQPFTDTEKQGWLTAVYAAGDFVALHGDADQRAMWSQCMYANEQLLVFVDRMLAGLHMKSAEPDAFKTFFSDIIAQLEDGIRYQKKQHYFLQSRIATRTLLEHVAVALITTIEKATKDWYIVIAGQ